ncbi:RNA polymerase sigma factor [Malonomonas rubra]|uniref:RNA polymerase sigma factor n=1 Tax=Malonomonas rubra TaxID=57040 RepID=UPI0026EACBCC|nr:RNA polymerase sigma factor [Malonomonas rubra]
MNLCVVDTLESGGYALPMETREEAILVEQARAGCEQSFEALVRQNSERMIQLAWRMVNHRQDAEEIVQEAFLRFHRSLDRFRGDSLVSTWLYRTVSRLCIDYLRRERIKRRLFFFSRPDDEFDPLAQAPANTIRQDDQAIARQELVHLMRALERLSPRQRAVLTLRHQEELPLKEIAEILGLSEGSVKVHLHRAVQGLRNSLAEMENSDD